MMGMGEKNKIYKTKAKEKIPRLVALPFPRLQKWRLTVYRRPKTPKTSRTSGNQQAASFRIPNTRVQPSLKPTARFLGIDFLLSVSKLGTRFTGDRYVANTLFCITLYSTILSIWSLLSDQRCMYTLYDPYSDDQSPPISSPHFILTFTSLCILSGRLVFLSRRSFWHAFCVTISDLIRWLGKATWLQLHIQNLLSFIGDI